MTVCWCFILKWAPSSEFVSSSIPSWHILTAHTQPFRGARDLAFCLKVSLDSLLVWASSGGSGETARMRRLAWTFAARIGDKYQIRLTRSKSFLIVYHWLFLILSIVIILPSIPTRLNECYWNITRMHFCDPLKINWWSLLDGSFLFIL